MNPPIARPGLATKILVRLVLNLILVGAAFALAFLLQVRVNPRWLLAGSAGERLQKIAEGVQSDLAIAGADRAPEILERYRESNEGLNFMLFELRPRDLASRGGEPPPREIAGRLAELPVEVRNALGRPRVLRLGRLARALGGGAGRDVGGGGGNNGGPGFGRPGFGPGANPGAGPGAANPDRPRRPSGLAALPPRGQPLQGDVLAAGNPRAYWFLVRIPPVDDDRTYSLVIRADNLLAASFLLDLHPWLLAAAGALVFSALFWLPFVLRMTRDVRRMMRGTEAIAAGHFETRLGLSRQDELGRLAEAIDQMAARLADHTAGQKRFLGDAAHELASPVARMQTAVAILENRTPTADQGYLQDLREELEAMAGLINELLSFSRASHGRPIRLEPTSLRAAVEKAWSREQTANGSLQIDVAPELRVRAAPGLLQRALANLLRNALRYAANDGPITVSARRESNAVVLVVADQGPGVPADSLGRLFEPFYRPESARTRESGGVGLGLAIVKTCIEACGGTVAAQNLQPRGFAVSLHLLSD